MKKVITIISVAALFLITTMSLHAQTAANATWALTADTTVAVTGDVVADGLVRAGGFAIKDYAGATMLTPALRLYFGSTQWGLETAPLFTRYVEFKVSPKPGFSFNVDSVSYIMACTGTSGHIFGNVYWDIDPTFGSKVIVDTSTVAVADIRSEAYVVKTYGVNFTVDNGKSFMLRFYPWYNGSMSNSKYFVLQNIVIKGTTTPASAVEGETEIPANFKLEQNYPNPFNPTTSISYSIPKTAFVTLKVYNLIGQEVASLVNEIKDPGNYKSTFDASKLSSGIYFYRLEAGNFVSIKKMALMK